MPPHGRDVVVSIPADAAFAHVLRSVAAAVGARVDLPVDDLEDLRLAVDEAFACLLGLGDGVAAVTLRLTPADAGVEALLTADGDGPAWPPAEGELPRQVLTALADGVRFDRVDGHPAVAFGKRSARR